MTSTTTPPSATPVGPPRVVTPTRTGIAFGALLAPTSLGVSATAVALPSLGDALDLAGPRTAWVLAGYALAIAVGLALSGRVADLCGLRPTLLTGAALIVVGSLTAGLAFSFPMLVAGRLTQGLGAAAMSVAALGTINATLDSADRSRALAWMTAVIAAVSGAGSLIGGLLTDLISWRAVLALPVLSVLGLVGAVRRAPRAALGSGRLDVAGAAFVVTAAAAAVLLLQARSTGLPGWAVLAVAGVLSLAAVATVMHVRRHPEGFLPAVVVGSTLFWRYVFVGGCLFAAYLAMLFTAPLLLAEQRGWSALQIGTALLPAAASAALVARLVGTAVARTSDRHVGVALAVTSTAGLLVAGLLPGPVSTIVGLTAAISAFAGAQVLLVGAIGRVVPAIVGGTAVALFNFLFNLGGALGSAAAGGLTAVLPLGTSIALIALLPAAAAAASCTLTTAGTPRFRAHPT